MHDIASKKTELRQWARQRRQIIPDRDLLSRDFAAHAGLLASAKCIAGFWPKGAEVDVRYLLYRLDEMGHSLALPRMQGQDLPLAFHAWKPGDALTSGPFHVQEPAFDAPAVVPDLVLVPLLAFDSHGWRLGYGGGFYDRTLEELSVHAHVKAVGVAFDAQQVPEIPRDSHDRRLHGVLTETGLTMVECQ